MEQNEDSAKNIHSSKRDFYCSFCNKSHDEVRELVGGPKAYICNECVEICLQITNPEFNKQTFKSKIALPDIRSAENNLFSARNFIGLNKPREALRHLRSGLLDICRGILIMKGYPKEKYTLDDTEWIDQLLINCTESHIPIHTTDAHHLLTCVSLEGACFEMNEVRNSLYAVEQLFDILKSRIKSGENQ